MKTWSRIVPLVLISTLACYGCQTHSGDKLAEEDESTDSSNALPKSYRPGIVPAGTFEAEIRRIPLKWPVLTGISDSGSLLFRENVLKDDVYIFVEQSKEKVINRRVEDPWPYLMPNGKVTMTTDPIGTMTDRFNTSYPYSSDHSIAVLFNDGSHLQLSIANLPGKKRATYSLQREWHSSAPRLNNGQIQNTLIKSVKIYAADNPIILLEKSENDVIWIQDHDGFDSRGIDKLIRIEQGKVESIPMPAGYENVQRVAQTGEKVVATFGIIRGKQPYRSFEMTKQGWKELPIPKGFDFSFVQKVFRDGSILGFVTTSDTKSMRNVLWKGDALAILDDLPGWPKQGSKSISNLANRNGLIGVKEFSSQVFTDSSQYLLQISVK